MLNFEYRKTLTYLVVICTIYLNFSFSLKYIFNLDRCNLLKYSVLIGISAVRTLCTCLVMAGLFITAEPQIFGINTDDDSNTANESTSARILWPLCFALGFLPIGLMNVICEKELKSGEVC